MTDQVVGGSVPFCLIHCKLITQPNHDVVDKSEHRIEGKNNLLGVWQVPADWEWQLWGVHASHGGWISHQVASICFSLNVSGMSVERFPHHSHPHSWGVSGNCGSHPLPGITASNSRQIPNIKKLEKIFSSHPLNVELQFWIPILVLTPWIQKSI